MAEKFPHFRPDYVIHPGETLAEALEERNMTQSELAQRMSRPKKTINEIINGKASITEETAIQLEKVLGVPAYFWLNLQTLYREAQARLEEHQRLESEVGFLKHFPIRDMINLKWIEKGKDQVDQLFLLLGFFGVSSPQAWEALTATYRASKAYKAKPGALSAWLRKGEIEAAKVQTPLFHARTFRSILDDLRLMTKDVPSISIPRMIKLCASAGVAVVLVPELPGCPLSGATYWPNAQKAVIQLSLRYKWADQFWFTFFHEAAHVLQMKKNGILFDGNQDPALEEEADVFASDHLIPPPAYAEFLQRHRGKHISQQNVLMFAQQIGIAAGCAVGRLQHDGIVPYSHMNGLRVRYEWATTN